jgi:lysophospholipase L1-like esterase
MPMYKPRSNRWKRKPRRRPWYVYALPIIGILLGLELLTRLVFGLTGLNRALTPQLSELAKRAETYQLGFLSPTGQPYENLSAGQLQAIRDPLLGYQLAPEQKSPYWTINAQGFRETEPLPTLKAPNEVRLFVMGGSMAFGQYSSSNQATLAHQLETLLNNQVKTQQANPNQFQPAILPYTADEVAKVMQRPERIPERQYRVVNAAVPGYTSGNDLALLMQQVAAYSPDYVVLLNSHEDLMLPSIQSGADVPGLDDLLAGKRESKFQMGETVQGWANQLYAVRGLQYLFQIPKAEDQAVAAVTTESLSEAIPKDATELAARVKRYQNNLAQMVRWSAASRKRILVGIQPELSSREAAKLPPTEQAILAKLGEGYSQRMQEGYTKLVAAAKQTTQTTANAKLLDLHSLYAKSDKPVFQSPTSLTDDAYKLLAEQFYRAIVEQLAITPQPYRG